MCADRDCTASGYCWAHQASSVHEQDGPCSPWIAARAGGIVPDIPGLSSVLYILTFDLLHDLLNLNDLEHFKYKFSLLAYCWERERHHCHIQRRHWPHGWDACWPQQGICWIWFWSPRMGLLRQGICWHLLLYVQGSSWQAHEQVRRPLSIWLTHLWPVLVS